MLNNQRGSIEIMSWLVVTTLLLFFVLIASTWLNLDRQQAVAAMAAREAARTGAIEYGKENPQAVNEAQNAAKKILVNGGLMKPGATFLPPNTSPSRGTNGVAITVNLSPPVGQWQAYTYVNVKCYTVNPFPNVFKFLAENRTEPYHFVWSKAAKYKSEERV